MIIRKAVPSDSAGIAECLQAAFEPYRNSYTADGFRDTVTIGARLETMTLFVGIHNGEVVGTIGCQMVDATEGHLRGMAVRPELQGTHLAPELLAAVEAELSRRGCRRVTLDTTEPLQRAARFYEKQGYQRTGRVTDFFGMPLFEYAKRL